MDLVAVQNAGEGKGLGGFFRGSSLSSSSWSLVASPEVAIENADIGTYTAIFTYQLREEVSQ